MMNLDHPVIKHFAEISKIPRCSGNEERIGAFIRRWAEENTFAHKSDPTGNLLISIPASPGQEDRGSIILQCHMDMVCEKNKQSSHDFAADPIRLQYDGDWLTAGETTLGADNGIGMAIAMAMAEDNKLRRPMLELLFTVDEESGLTGANALSADFFTGRTLINLDSEDEGVFTIGCAGGRDSEIILPLEYEPCPQNSGFIELKVHGLAGGHSGVNIGEQRPNANVILATILKGLKRRHGFRLADISGGSAHNAIPREASAILLPMEVSSDTYRQQIEKLEKTTIKAIGTETGLEISTVVQSGPFKRVYSENATRRCIDLISAAPNGVIAMSKEVPGLVETSVNFALIRKKEAAISLVFSQRSDRAQAMDILTLKLEALAGLAGAEIITGKGYPGWQPDIQSELLARCKKIYQELFTENPKVEVIHAGLECGIIGAISPGMEMISIGPTIKNPHSPGECLHLPSVERVNRLLREVISSYCSK